MDMYNRFFIYSQFQRKEKENIANNMSKKYVPGSLVIKGQKKLFTDIVLNTNNVRYSDYKIVAEGDIRKMKYTAPEMKE